MAPEVLTIVGAVLAGLVVVGNFGAWVGEAYVRRQEAKDFYDVARRGASARLVDIGGYLQKHAGGDETVWFNRGAERRVAHFLVGRRVLVRDVRIGSWDDQSDLRTFLDGVAAEDRWAVVFVDEPAPGWIWPRWHFGLGRASRAGAFYRLMEKREGGWREVEVPVERGYVRGIPASSK